ncbi:hypothetical protein U9M48_017185 [Paspalum notatum var. saurae]|uniref:ROTUNDIFOLIA like 8 n=1 Tax=Paspalum notatum var. saurae TaxID=547442 RepID=A0AAQ3TB16_PASNO
MELLAAEEKPCRLFRRRSGGGKGAMGVRADDGSAGKGRSFSGRCARLVKEHCARFYIMRRCVTMLVCWREYA